MQCAESDITRDTGRQALTALRQRVDQLQIQAWKLFVKINEESPHLVSQCGQFFYYLVTMTGDSDAWLYRKVSNEWFRDYLDCPF